MTVHCPECGHEVAEGRFCARCGAVLAESSGDDAGSSLLRPRGAADDEHGGEVADAEEVTARPASRWTAGFLVVVLAVLVGAAAIGRSAQDRQGPLPSSDMVRGDATVAADGPTNTPRTSTSPAGDIRARSWQPPPQPRLRDGWEVHEGRRYSLHHPGGWTAAGTRWITLPSVPQDLVSVASYDLAALDPEAEVGPGCPGPLPATPVVAMATDDVLLMLLSPRYAYAAPDAVLLGAAVLPTGEVERARDDVDRGGGGICGTDATFHVLYVRVEDWVYEAWLVVGPDAPQQHISAAIRILNSFRPDL